RPPRPRRCRYTTLFRSLAQREALLQGKTYEDALQECLEAGIEPEKAKWLAKHRVHPGGRPSNLIVLPKLTPYTLGALLALYEHKDRKSTRLNSSHVKTS